MQRTHLHRRLIVATLGLAFLAGMGCGDDDLPPPVGDGGPADGGVMIDGGDVEDGGPGDGGDADGGAPAWEWDLPPGFPEPRVPDDNPMSEAKVELGRHLFYDTRLSLNETQSCGSCHEQASAFTDDMAHAIGSTGMTHPRSSMSLTNVTYQATLTWANPVVRTLEDQALLPIFGEAPIIELGMVGNEALLIERLETSTAPDYRAMFAESFPEAADPITIGNVVRAIGAFERTMISGRSPYDRYTHEGDETAMSDSAVRGMELFFGETFECFHCHGGFNFSASVDHAGTVFDEAAFFNTGLYNTDGRGAYPPDNIGLAEISGDPDDMGRFKPPTLRNIAVTAPYMHDGSIATLEEVLAHYARGGRNVTTGPYVGDGRDSPYKSELVSGFTMTDQERDDVIAFLNALTDDAFLTDPRFSNPFE